MSSGSVEADYLVVGAGATAMAFVDTLLDESDASVVMVDRHDRPGGHWNDAYPFVRLHQPSGFYGVNSRQLGSGTKDAVGLNQGLYELASGAEVLDYFEQHVTHRSFPLFIGHDSLRDFLFEKQRHLGARYVVRSARCLHHDISSNIAARRFGCSSSIALTSRYAVLSLSFTVFGETSVSSATSLTV